MKKINTSYQVTLSDFRRATYFGMFQRYRRPLQIMAVVLLVGLRAMAQKEFGGMSGDLAGYLITLSELVLLACFLFAERVVLICF